MDHIIQQIIVDQQPALLQAVEQLRQALATLDYLGLSHAAIHVDTALNLISDQVAGELIQFKLDSYAHVDFTHLDTMAMELFS